MPQYSYEHAFTAGKTRDTEEELEMPCHWGILCDVRISWRWGTGRLCHVHIDDGLHQIFPTNPEGSLAYDGYTLEINDEYELLEGTRKLYLRGWNEGSYPHTVAVSFRIRLVERLTTTEALLYKIFGVFESALQAKPKQSKTQSKTQSKEEKKTV